MDISVLHSLAPRPIDQKVMGEGTNQQTDKRFELLDTNRPSTNPLSDDDASMSTMSTEDRARQRRMSILANAGTKELLDRWLSLGIDPAAELLRGPETGLIALRGRIGGGGAPFNFGEATVTRATVRMENGAIGHAIMLGRDAGKVKLAAVIDALATDDIMAGEIEDKILTPLAAAAADRDREQDAKTQATRVNFFTMVRGDD